jgi:2-oxoglutarate ferredoxin oxidoreductase subunit gamma
MTQEIMIAGFGGQGVLSMGMTLAYAGIIEGNEISWMPSYGPEMRGGTANCIVIVSDRKVSSPIVTTFDVLVAMNQPSLEKFQGRVKPGGLLIYDSANIIVPPSRQDLFIMPVPASDEAESVGNKKVANMVILGALIARTEILHSNSVLCALSKVLPARYHHLLALNERALERGGSIAGQGAHGETIPERSES